MKGTWYRIVGGAFRGQRLESTDLDILAFFVANHNLDDEVLRVRRERLLAHVLDEFAELHRQALLALLFADERAPEHADALGDHAHVELVLAREVIDDVLERRVVLELEPVPERPVDAVVSALLRRDGLREAEERQCQVDEAVLVVLQFLLPIDELWAMFLASARRTMIHA